MTASELAHGIQCTVDPTGAITAVVLTPELWQRVVSALEDAEDRALVQTLHTHLEVHPATTGALRWVDVADDWA